MGPPGGVIELKDGLSLAVDRGGAAAQGPKRHTEKLGLGSISPHRVDVGAGPAGRSELGRVVLGTR